MGHSHNRLQRSGHRWVCNLEGHLRNKAREDTSSLRCYRARKEATMSQRRVAKSMLGESTRRLVRVGVRE